MVHQQKGRPRAGTQHSQVTLHYIGEGSSHYIYIHITLIYYFVYNYVNYTKLKMYWYCILQIELRIHLLYLEDQRNLKIYKNKY